MLETAHNGARNSPDCVFSDIKWPVHLARAVGIEEWNIACSNQPDSTLGVGQQLDPPLECKRLQVSVNCGRRLDPEGLCDLLPSRRYVYVDDLSADEIVDLLLPGERGRIGRSIVPPELLCVDLPSDQLD